MKENKMMAGLIAGLNIAGLVCLICLLVPYLTHNTLNRRHDSAVYGKSFRFSVYQGEKNRV